VALFANQSAKIEELQLENESLKQVARFETDVAAQAIADFNAMRLEVEALRKDAERYQWLRSRPMSTDEEIYIGVDSSKYTTKWALSGEEADLAIDAAIKGEQA
jgi:hypothetical protein